ncbi:hypothetical protein [Eilatimonas milleporae]|uniref:Uncharacterized protein n=1 Tax=Eilatimonas milleporae TaxID=911205 RepID=A0A3M0C494_9PROT|nr:hypothetical protein [Eilatimonas milleporae]RMB04681.1 hypothetical protein BXY39_2952 [Eilatimonas milleporae]
MPIYFKIRDTGAPPGQPLPDLLTRPTVGPAGLEKPPQEDITAYLDGTGNPSLPVYHGNLPTMAFGNLAQYRMHNFDTALIMNGAVDLNDVEYGHFLRLFDDIYLNASHFPHQWAHVKDVAQAFGEAYRRIIAELAGTSITTAVARRIVNGLFRDANTVPVLADYDQVRRHFDIDQNVNRADYVWLMFTPNADGTVDIVNTLVAEAKGSLRRRAPNQARINTAVTQTIATIEALNDAGFNADGVSEALYTLDGTPMDPQLENRWEINLIDPGEKGGPITVDWHTFHTFAAPKFAYMKDVFQRPGPTTFPQIGNGERTVEVVSKTLATSAGTYTANLPVDVFEAANEMTGNPGKDLFDAILKYRRWMGDGKAPPIIEADDYGDYFFGSLFFPGDGYFIGLVPHSGPTRFV